MSRVAWAGLLAAVALAAAAGLVASRSPDGLQRVAADQGFAQTERRHALADGPLAGYSVEGVEDEGIGAALAGAIGVVATAVAVIGGLTLLRRGAREDAS